MVAYRGQVHDHRGVPVPTPMTPHVLIDPNDAHSFKASRIRQQEFFLIGLYRLVSGMPGHRQVSGNAIDGHIARSRNMITTFGKFADPIADKLLTTTMFLLFISRGIIPVIPVIIMIARDTVVDGCRMMASANGKVVAAGMMGKLKTVLQMVTVALILLNNLPFELLGLPVSMIMLWFSALVSFISGVQYFMQMKDDILESK